MPVIIICYAPSLEYFQRASPVLANPVAARCGLQVILGVEVGVDENSRVSSCKV